MTTTRDIGERLREAREKKGLTIKQVQEDTKIRRRYIEAMEAGEFDFIPGGEVYQRGFMRTYARYLGMDERVLLEEWRLLHAPPEGLEDKGFKGEHQQRSGTTPGHVELKPQNTRIQRTQKKEISANGRVVRRAAVRPSMRAVRGRGVIRWGLVLLVVLILAFAAGRGFYRVVMGPGRIGGETDRVGEGIEGQKPPEGAAGRSEGGAKEGGSLGSEPGEADIVPRDGGSQTALFPAVPKSTVVISEDTKTKRKYAVFGDVAEVTLLVTELTDRCWIRAVADEGRPFEAELLRGQSMHWSVENNLRIRCGRPWAVKIVVNGKEYEPDGQISPPKDFIFEVVKEVKQENN